MPSPTWAPRRGGRHLAIRDEYPTIESLVNRVMLGLNYDESRDFGDEGTHVYLIESHGNGYIKVGKSNSVAHRFDQISTMSPVDDLRLIASWPESWLPEGALHDWFRPEHQHGEWFSGPEIEGFAAEIDYLLEEM